MQQWLCPTDRQLRLRACISRGWSTSRQAVASLTPAECAAVGEVMRRDRALRLLDRGRVGRAAEHIERLRLAQRGDGADSCRLCGRRLRHCLWRPSVRCDDCDCRFCVGCTTPVLATEAAATDAESDGVQHHDGWLCKLCRETRLLTAKSGAWFNSRLLDAPSPQPLDDLLSEVATNQEEEEEEEEEEREKQEAEEVVTSLPAHKAASGRPGRLQTGKKSLSHSDLHEHQAATDEHKGKLQHLHLHLPSMMKRRKSASCSHLGQLLQCEYFPTELAGE